MTQLSIPRPAADEAAPSYQGYIAKVPGENIGEQLVDQLAEVERLFGALDDTAALARYAPTLSPTSWWAMWRTTSEFCGIATGSAPEPPLPPSR